jgi:hypothetical protein
MKVKGRYNDVFYRTVRAKLTATQILEVSADSLGEAREALKLHFESVEDASLVEKVTWSVRRT